MKMIFMVMSIATTALCWGVYGPVLHWGQHGMGAGRLRPLMCVGLAYFAIAIVIPLIFVHLFGWESEEKFAWTFKGTVWSLAAGAAGALGALGIILAFNFDGTPIVVMPLVFGCAPIVNTLWTSFWNKSWDQMSPMYLAGMILVAVGAVVVLVWQPKAPPKTTSKAEHPKYIAAAEIKLPPSAVPEVEGPPSLPPDESKAQQQAEQPS